MAHLSSSEAEWDLADILETATYLICQNNEVTKKDFQKIMTSPNIPKKTFRLINKNKIGHVTVADIMNFVLTITKPLDSIIIRRQSTD